MSNPEIPQQALVLVTSVQAFLLLSVVLASLVCLLNDTLILWFSYEIHGALCLK